MESSWCSGKICYSVFYNLIRKCSAQKSGSSLRLSQVGEVHERFEESWPAEDRILKDFEGIPAGLACWPVASRRLQSFDFIELILILVILYDFSWFRKGPAAQKVQKKYFDRNGNCMTRVENMICSQRVEENDRRWEILGALKRYATISVQRPPSFARWRRKKKSWGSGQVCETAIRKHRKNCFSSWALPRAMELLPLALVLLRRTPRAPGIA